MTLRISTKPKGFDPKRKRTPSSNSILKSIAKAKAKEGK